jgi:hypothetical protein
MLPDLDRRRPIRRQACRCANFASFCTALGLSLLIASPAARAATSGGDSFEGAETSWHFAEADAAYRLESHQRTSEGAHRGSGCEQVRFQAGAGRHIYLALDISPVYVIDELRPSIWVRANRPGGQLLARVVFPRTADPKTGKPLARLVGGSRYTQQGAWEQLRLEQLPKLVEAVVRPMRAQYGSHLDAREAYIDRLALNVYSGPGVTQLAIDDLELPHVVSVDERSIKPTEAAVAGTGARRRVELSGSILLLDGHPFFPCMVEHRGESFSFLKGLGFNAIKLSSAPSAALLEEARQAGVWLVCPPPVLQASDDQTEEVAQFGSLYEPVLAWHLGQGLTARDLDAMRVWVEQLRRADEEVSRPLVCDPADELPQYSRLLGAGGILMMHRHLLGTTFEMADYGTWLRMRPILGMPGMPVWATIETQHSRELSEQIALLSAGRAPEPMASFEQLRLMVQAALAAGVRGLSFASQSPLDGQDAATRARATSLALINVEVDHIRPWIAAGTAIPEMPAANATGTNPGISGAVLQASRTRLLLPLWAGTGAQYVPDQLAGNLITFVVRGAPEANSVYEVTAGGLRVLNSKRDLGGVHIKLNEFGLTSLILLTDQLAVGATTKRLWSAGPRAAQLQRELATYKLNYVTEVDRQLARLADRVLDAPRLFGLARSELAEAENSIKQRDWLAACVAAQRSMRPLRLIERSHWEKAIASIGSPAASPLVASFGEIPYHWLLARELESLSRSRSLLEQGDLEALPTVWKAGWRLYKHGQNGVKTMGAISREDHYSGQASLHLSVAAVDIEEPPAMLETPPLWVTSPPIPAETGQWFRIHGWIKVPKAIEASLDGLMIFDSLAREPLAERIGQTEGWKEFMLYRAAPASGPWRLTIALTGLGDAWVDGLTVETLRTPQPTRALSRTDRRLQPTGDKR